MTVVNGRQGRRTQIQPERVSVHGTIKHCMNGILFVFFICVSDTGHPRPFRRRGKDGPLSTSVSGRRRPTRDSCPLPPGRNVREPEPS